MCRRMESNKTRIETTKATKEDIFGHAVGGWNPIKQGLKLVASAIGINIMLGRRMESNKTRIETSNIGLYRFHCLRSRRMESNKTRIETAEAAYANITPKKSEDGIQ